MFYVQCGRLTKGGKTNGDNVTEYTYDEWGNITSITDGQGNDVSANQSHIANINPLRYRSYFYDTETGFYWLNTRYYDPAIGRFINADSYASTGQGVIGHNMFAYCGNNAVNRIDPSGCFFEEAWEFIKKVAEKTKEAVEGLAYAYAGCVGTAVADGPLPFADVVSAVGVVVITAGAIGKGVYEA